MTGYLYLGNSRPHRGGAVNHAQNIRLILVLWHSPDVNFSFSLINFSIY